MSTDIGTYISVYQTLPDDIETINILVIDDGEETHIRLSFFPDRLESEVREVINKLYDTLQSVKASKTSQGERFDRKEIHACLTEAAPELFNSTLYGLPFGQVHVYDKGERMTEARSTLLTALNKRVDEWQASQSDHEESNGLEGLEEAFRKTFKMGPDHA